PHITAGERLLAPLERLIGVRSIDEADEGVAKLVGHVVIVGFGVGGRFAAQTLAATGAPYVVLELNAENVRRAKELALPVYYGDATSTEALGHAHLVDARLLVLLMNDPQAAQRVVDTARRVAPNVPILMRTRYLGERPALLSIGATEVVAEEVEGAAEVIARMLRYLEVPRNVIDDRLRSVRQETQGSERKPTLPRSQLSDVRGLDELKIESALVREGSAIAGRSPVALRLRSRTGALVVGIRRDGRLLDKLDPTLPFEPGDVVYLVGTSTAIRGTLPLFNTGSIPPPEDTAPD
ncbi:MAG TPA: NAD-binding protein, partial [Polyangiaceae bacterium]